MPTGEGGSPFDLIQSAAFNVITSTMGYKVEWTPSAGGPVQTARACFKDPSKEQSLNNVVFEDAFPFIEYKFGVFPGLKESVDRTTNAETISVYFTKTGPATVYDVRKVKAKWDGKTFIATLEEKEA